jgi:tetratricopeptide (TPR) repeat protein
MKFHLILIALGFSHLLKAQYPQLPNLQFGAYSVGFQVFNQLDKGRYIKPKVDFEGKIDEGERALPVQIAVWYPAQKPNNANKILLEEYAFLTKQVNHYQVLSEKDKQEAREIVRFSAKFGANIDLTDSQILELAQSPTSAVKDASPIKEKFPLILCAYQGGPSLNNILGEYLASWGYVVVATSAIRQVATWQANKPQLAINEGVNNLEYLLDFAQSLPFADCQKMGLIGVNFEGMSALLFQMKNMQADAIVSIDGYEGKVGTTQSLFQSVYFEANKLRIPYFSVMQDEQSPSDYLRLSQKALDTLQYSARYYYVLSGMNHSYLIANLGILPNLTAEKYQAYTFLYQSIGHFFSAYLKKTPSSLSFIQKTSVENGFSREIAKVEIKKTALPAVPTTEEFEKLVMSGDLAKVTKIYTEARKLNPKIQLFDYQTLNLFSFRYNQQKKYDKVLAIWQLAAEAYPNSAQVQEKLGDTYLNLNNPTSAKESYKKALDLLPQNQSINANDRENFKKTLFEKIEKIKP